MASIGYGSRGHFEPPMQCQYANPGPIQCQSRPRFGLAISRQSEKIEVNPVQCKHQFGANRGSDQQLVCCQSNANRCQSIANPSSILCQSIANPLPIRCQPTEPILCQSGANPSPIECQSSANPVPIQCQSAANTLPIQCQPAQTILRQSSTNRVPIHRQFFANLVPIRCQ